MIRKPSQHVQLVTVLVTGKRYIVKAIEQYKVRCYGEIELVREETLQTKHGPDRLFMLDRVTIATLPRTPQLLEELWQQNREAWLLQLQFKKEEAERQYVRQYVTESGELTERSIQELQNLGHDIGEVASYNQENEFGSDSYLQEAAMETALYCDLPLGEYSPMNILRELAADIIYDAAIKARDTKCKQLAS